MGSGLKEGGHHRRALDVASKKRAQKSARKGAQAEAGARAVILQKLLTLDADADVYLEDPEGRPMCLSYFRYDRCTNRRCNLSHDHSIGDAVSNFAGEEEKGTMPAVEWIPGFGLRTSSSSSARRRRTIIDRPTPGAAGAFEALPETAIGIIAAYFSSDTDVGNAAMSCRHLRHCLMNSKDVQRRRRVAFDAKLQTRNDLLRNKSTASRLRFAVSYANLNCDMTTTTSVDHENNNDEDGKKQRMKGKKKGGRGEMVTGPRPTLAYDFENPQVFRAFEASHLPSAFAANVRVHDP